MASDSLVGEGLAKSPYDELRAENERLRESLTKLIGIMEIASVMPAAIGKSLLIPWECPELNAARAELARKGDENGF